MFSDASRCSQMSSMPTATHPAVLWRLDISKSSEHAHRAANRNLSRRVASRCSLGSIWSATSGRAGAVLFLTNLFITRRAQQDFLFVCSLPAAGLDARRCWQMLLDALRCSQMLPVARRCSECFICSQLLPDGARCSQMFTYANTRCESFVYTLTRTLSPGRYEASAWSAMRFSLLSSIVCWPTDPSSASRLSNLPAESTVGHIC